MLHTTIFRDVTLSSLRQGQQFILLLLIFRDGSIHGKISRFAYAARVIVADAIAVALS